MNIPDKPVLNVKDMMNILEVSKTTLYSYISKGYLPADAILLPGKFKQSKIKEWLCS